MSVLRSLTSDTPPKKLWNSGFLSAVLTIGSFSQYLQQVHDCPELLSTSEIPVNTIGAGKRHVAQPLRES